MANLADMNPSMLQNLATQLPQAAQRGLDQQELTRALLRQQQQQQQQQGIKVGLPSSSSGLPYPNPQIC